jgi:sporulation protein YabP
MEEKQMQQGKHRITMDNRKKCSLTGVTDVISFDLNRVLLETELGILDIKGNDLHVNRLSVEKGEVDIAGEIDSLTYTEVKEYSKKAESFFTKMFR